MIERPVDYSHEIYHGVSMVNSAFYHGKSDCIVVISQLFQSFKESERHDSSLQLVVSVSSTHDCIDIVTTIIVSKGLIKCK